MCTSAQGGGVYHPWNQRLNQSLVQQLRFYMERHREISWELDSNASNASLGYEDVELLDMTNHNADRQRLVSAISA